MHTNHRAKWAGHQSSEAVKEYRILRKKNLLFVAYVPLHVCNPYRHKNLSMVEPYLYKIPLSGPAPADLFKLPVDVM